MILKTMIVRTTLIKSFLCMACALTFSSCEKNKTDFTEPDVEVNRPFTDYEIVPGDDPFTFKFENKSTNYKELEWRFGDDSLSTEVSPTHMYFKDGTYEVNLKATAADGTTARKLLKVVIKPEDVATISGRFTGVQNNVKFVANTDVDIKSVKWEFGDNTESEELSPVKVYEEGKLYTVKLTVTTNKGSIAQISKLVSSNGTIVDVTNDYLLNTGPKFIASERFGNRWGVVADWRVNAAVRQRDGGMGGWDEWEGNSMSMESWGGEPDINNGKIQQTLLKELPAGQYYYQMIFHDFQVKDQLYNVAAKGSEIPDVDKVTTDPNVLGYTKFMGNGPTNQTTAFSLSAPSQVTLGFVSTFIQNDQNFKLTTVRLYKLD